MTIPKYISTSQKKLDMIISNLKASKRYSAKEIDSIYETSESHEADFYKLVGILTTLKIKKLGSLSIDSLISSENKFRIELAKLVKSEKNQSLNSELEDQSISLKNIKFQPKKRDFDDFNLWNLIEIVVRKKDLEILNLMRNKFIEKKK